MGLRSVLTLLALSAATVCAADSTYGADRLADLGDIIDRRYGQSMGLGAKIEVTHFLGVGLGFAGLRDVTESYGRDPMKWNQAGFAHFVIVGTDGAFGACPGPPGTWDFDILGVNLPAFGWHDQPQSFDWFRFGGELVLPFVTGGIYLNVGQLVDGVAGIATWDPAADDRATELEREGRTEALRADQPVTPAPAEP